MTENANANTPSPEGAGDEPQTPEIRQTDGTRRPMNNGEKNAWAAAMRRRQQQQPTTEPKGQDEPKGDETPTDQQQEQRHGDETSTELEVPGETPKEHVERIEGYLTDLAPMAKEARIPASELQDIVDFAVSLGVSDTSRIDYAGNPDASIATLKRTYGDEGAAKIIADA